jgi:hypothetical protein
MSGTGAPFFTATPMLTPRERPARARGDQPIALEPLEILHRHDHEVVALARGQRFNISPAGA